MTKNHSEPQTPPQGIAGPLALSLWSIIIAAALGMTVGATAFSKVALVGPQLSTTIEIGAGAAQVRVTIAIN